MTSSKIKITYTKEFEKEYKRLSKKFHSLESDIRALIQTLHNQPELGTALGKNVFKIRWQVKSKGKGKSGGVRVITYYLSEGLKLYLLTIYDKSDRDSISQTEIKTLLKDIQ